jgi:hypothetical protein
MSPATHRHRLPNLPASLLAMLLALQCAIVPVARAADVDDVDDAIVDRLTDAMVRMLPVGAIVDAVAAKDPAWPAGEKAGEIGAAPLACLRKELSSEGYRRFMRGESLAYANRNKATLEDEVKLAEAAAPILGGIVAASIDGKDVDSKTELGKLSADEMLAFLGFAYDPKYAGLRQLSGYGEFPSDNAEQKDQKAMQMMMIKMTLRAMGTCDVSPAHLF